MTYHAGSAGLSLTDGFDLSGLSLTDLWLLYIGLGGTETRRTLSAQIARDDNPDTALEPYQHNLIAQAINEHFIDRHNGHPVGYRDHPDALPARRHSL